MADSKNQTQEAEVPTPEVKSVKTKEVKKKREMSPLKRKILIAALVIGVIATLIFIYDSMTHAETDDAYVTGHLHYISPRISGVVQQVFVEDNQTVKEGDVLVKLDPADYQNQFNEAQANMEKAKTDLDRSQALMKVSATSREEVDHAQADFEVAKARYEMAQLNLSYTSLTAPAAGWVGRKNVEVGNRVQPGQALMVVVEGDVWVIANFKETQLAKMKPHQPVRLTIDAVPGKKFEGYVESFSPASGSQFALLPADNSTGNFTKIVQRVPVKIQFKPESIQGYENRIRPGMSVIVKVSLNEKPEDRP